MIVGNSLIAFLSLRNAHYFNYRLIKKFWKVKKKRWDEDIQKL